MSVIRTSIAPPQRQEKKSFPSPLSHFRPPQHTRKMPFRPGNVLRFFQEKSFSSAALCPIHLALLRRTG
jgi:hypothetical protein